VLGRDDDDLRRGLPSRDLDLEVRDLSPVDDERLLGDAVAESLEALADPHAGARQCLVTRVVTEVPLADLDGEEPDVLANLPLHPG